MAPRVPLRRLIGGAGAAVLVGSALFAMHAVLTTDDPLSRAKTSSGSDTTRKRWPPLADQSSYSENSLPDACADWKCTCQGLSDLYGTSPGHWEKARDKEIARTFWLSHRCSTCPGGSCSGGGGGGAGGGGGGEGDDGGGGGDSSTLPEVSSGATVTAVLTGKATWPDERVKRLRFRPGTLELNSTMAFRHCYVDPVRYRDHFLLGRGRIGVIWTNKHKLIYIQVRRTG